jgi:hypothetical protein
LYGLIQSGKTSILTVSAAMAADNGFDCILIAESLVGLAQIERDLKQNTAATEHYTEAVAILRNGPDPLRLAHTVRHLADVLRNIGSLEEARPTTRMHFTSIANTMKRLRLTWPTPFGDLRCSAVRLANPRQRSLCGRKRELYTRPST